MDHSRGALRPLQASCAGIVGREGGRRREERRFSSSLLPSSWRVPRHQPGAGCCRINQGRVVSAFQLSTPCLEVRFGRPNVARR